MSNRSSMMHEGALDRVFSALSHQTRRSMLARLQEGTATVTELAEPFDMSLPAASKHLRVLERAGLVKRTIDGRVHRCALEAGPLSDAQAWLSHYEVFWRDTLDNLARHLEGENE